MKLWMIFLFYLLLSSSQVFGNESTCFDLIRQLMVSKTGVWNAVTKRTYNQYILDLKTASLDGVTGPMQAFQPDRLIKKNQHVLSMGEGSGSFIKTLIEKKEMTQSLSQIHAVDTVYGRIDDVEDVNLNEFISSHPDNYYAALFQDFSLPFVMKGELYDEIISSYSLTFILDQYPEILVKVLKELLASNGYLRIWPTYDGLYKVLLPMMEEMRESGLVKNYSKFRENVLIIQKR